MYYSGDKSRIMKRSGHAARLRVRRGTYRVLEGIPYGKMLLERPRRRWEDNTKMYLQEVGCGGMNWIPLT
jgi:hypothetical protein